MISKFRAWDKTTNQMRGCYGFNSMAQEVYVCSVADEEFKGRLKTVHAIKRSFDEVILMQSTGLKDKKGVEIFEGDIVKIKQQDSIDKYIPNNSNNEIVYKDSAFCIKETRETSDIKWPIVAGLYYKASEEFQVIGNIYENPELLEVAE